MKIHISKATKKAIARSVHRSEMEEKPKSAAEAREAAVKRAEEQIRNILHDLAIEIGGGIESVNVDTRNFGQLSTSIFTSVDTD